MPIRSSPLRVVPFTILCSLLVRHPQMSLPVSLNRTDTETVTALTATLFGNRCRCFGLTVATFGQAYPSEQLLPPAVVPVTFAARAADLARHVSPQLDQGGTLPALLPVCSDSQISQLAPSRMPPLVPGKDKDSPCQIIGFPCVLLGRERALTAFLQQCLQQDGSDPLSPLPPTHPALLALTEFFQTSFRLPREAVHVAAPLPLHAVKTWLKDLGVPNANPSLSPPR
jgi:hypothetical protein